MAGQDWGAGDAWCRGGPADPPCGNSRGGGVCLPPPHTPHTRCPQILLDRGWEEPVELN